MPGPAAERHSRTFGESMMLYPVQSLIETAQQNQVRMPYGSWVPARPLWSAMGRWRHAWWVLTGRCDAVWWPEDGNPYVRSDSG
jgi:hypothetical protein